MGGITEIIKVMNGFSSANLEKILSFSKTCGSYEEWINWELQYCFSKHPFVSNPKPNYKSFGNTKFSKSQADLLIRRASDSREFIVEVSLVGEKTQGKWLKKIERDREKLLDLAPSSPHHALEKIQVVVLVASYHNIVSEWEGWLSRLSFWSEPSRIEGTARSPDGEVVICAWSVNGK